MKIITVFLLVSINCFSQNYFKSVTYDSDKATISKKWDNASILFHYNFIENSILQEIEKTPKDVLDVGPGYGHWVGFYQGVFPKVDVEAIEISQPMSDTVRNIYGIKVYNCGIEDTVVKEYDIVNAIGVLHHIMEDSVLNKALNNISQMMKKDGMLFIGTRLVLDDYKRERVRNFRTLFKWDELLLNNGLDIHYIDISRPVGNIKKHLDLIVVKKIK
jgi:SAM-dependent methyltransferase